MAPDAAQALLALQFADTGFPAGGFAFSWGLEGLAADGLVTDAADVADLIAEQLTHRWHSMDRVLLGRAYAARDLDALAEVDRLSEATNWSAPMRAGSRRAGRALLAVCARMELPDALRYRAEIACDARLGHLAVVQGLVFRAAGLSLDMAELLSGWAVVTTLSSAAVRLGVIGHLEALATVSRSRPVLAGLLDQTASSSALPASFTPLTDIAVTRNSLRELRMFAT